MKKIGIIAATVMFFSAMVLSTSSAHTIATYKDTKKEVTLSKKGQMDSTWKDTTKTKKKKRQMNENS